MLTLASEVTCLTAIPTERARALASLGIRTIGDLLYYRPRGYLDRRNYLPSMRQAHSGETVTLAGTVRTTCSRRTRAGQVFEVELSEGPRWLCCRWLHAEHLEHLMRPGRLLVVHGAVEADRALGGLRMREPEFELLATDDDLGAGITPAVGRIVPVYCTDASARLSSRFFRQAIFNALEQQPEIADPLPMSVRARLKLPELGIALRNLHFPQAGRELIALNRFETPEQFRLIFEELFYFQVACALRRLKRQEAPGISFKLAQESEERVRLLNPRPTPAQKRVLREIKSDMLGPQPMERLLVGDVGSGKWIVSLQAAAIAIENGYQVAVIAPSEVLAGQEFLYFRELCTRAGYQSAFISRETPAAGKARLKRAAASGRLDIVVGTPGLVYRGIGFRRLGLVIVDEQHGASLLQHIKLHKGPRPDVLVTTSTPIPRALQLTLYGDLDISVIDRLQQNRFAVTTRRIPEARINQARELVRREVEAGRQAYIVYPVLEGSEKIDLDSAIELHRRLSSEVFPNFRVGLLHTRMTFAEKESVIQAFKAGRLQLLVTTVAIEIGSYVPNATVMVVEQAEKFDIAQLHQLRGRLGNAAEECFCILVTRSPLSDQLRERIGVFVRTHDGFHLAEADFALRDPAEFFAARQSGAPAFRVADLRRDREVLELARTVAQDFLNLAPREEVAALMRYLREGAEQRYDFVCPAATARA